MTRTLNFAVTLASIAVYFWSQMAFAQPNPSTAPDAGAGANLALVAKASASYVSGDQTLAALNSGFDPRNSRDTRHRAYGDWPRIGVQWVEYDWTQPISTNKIDVYWL